jgi:hypothetical protein
LLYREDQPTGNRQATGSSARDTAIRRFSAEVRIYNQGSNPVPVSIAHQFVDAITVPPDTS